MENKTKFLSKSKLSTSDSTVTANAITDQEIKINLRMHNP